LGGVESMHGEGRRSWSGPGGGGGVWLWVGRVLMAVFGGGGVWAPRSGWRVRPALESGGRKGESIGAACRGREVGPSDWKLACCRYEN